MRTIGAALLSVAFLGFAAQAAEAARRPTPKERAAIARYQHLPASCAIVKISTAAHGWAGFYGASSRKACMPWWTDGVTVLRKRHGRWRYIAAGSDMTCPIRGVPDVVAWDLHACWGDRLSIHEARSTALFDVRDLREWVATTFEVPQPSAHIDYCDRASVTRVSCVVIVENARDSSGDVVLCSEPGVDMKTRLPGIVDAEVDALSCGEWGPDGKLIREAESG